MRRFVAHELSAGPADSARYIDDGPYGITAQSMPPRRYWPSALRQRSPAIEPRRVASDVRALVTAALTAAVPTHRGFVT